MTQKSQTNNPLTTDESGDYTPAIFLSAQIPMDIKLVESIRGGWLKVGSVMKTKKNKKKTGLYLAKRGSDNITSSSVAIRTNLFPSKCMITIGGMESTGSKQGSLSN